MFFRFTKYSVLVQQRSTKDGLFSNLFVLLVLLGVLICQSAWFLRPAMASAQSIDIPDCTGSYVIDRTLTTNARWEFCWEHRSREGIVFHNIIYTSPNGTRRKILKQASLAQVHTPYNDNSYRYHYVTDLGLGGDQMVSLQPEDCPEGTVHSHQSSLLLCEQSIARGYIYKSYLQQRQGEYLSLYSVSDLGSQSLIVRWRFYEDGSIEPSVGSTGQLQQTGSDPQFGGAIDSIGTIGIGYVNNYFWRFDFDIGENGANDIVEEFNVVSTNLGSEKELSVTQLTEEMARSINPQQKRSWRIRDASITNSEGHSVSYHLEPMNVGNRYIGPDNEPWTHHDIYFTRYKQCEQFASHNPQLGGCGENVYEFIDGENINSVDLNSVDLNGEGANGADLVIWYRVSYHHWPSSEYQPFIPIHWDTVLLIPRDWTAKSELAN